MNGHGFQYTPMGIVPIGVSAPVQPRDDVAPGIVHRAKPAANETTGSAQPSTAAPPALGSAPAQTALAFDAGRPLTGKQLMAVAKARIKELDRLLRQVPALEAERASLHRLVCAAKPPAAKSRSVLSIKAANGATHQ